MEKINKTVYYLGQKSKIEEYKKNGLYPSYKIERYGEEICLFESIDELRKARFSWLGSYLKAAGKGDFVVVKIDAPIDDIIRPILAQKIVQEMTGNKDTTPIPKIKPEYLSYFDEYLNPIEVE